MSGWLAAAAAAASAAVAVALLCPPTVRVRRPPATTTRPVDRGWMVRYRPIWCGCAGVGAALVVGGAAAPVAALAGAVAAWVVIARAEPPAERRRREQVRRDLPHVVDLLAAALRAGAAPDAALTVVCAALPGPAAARLAGVSARLGLGLDPVQVWESLGDDPDLAPLGRTLARAQASGSSVVPSVERLADDLARQARADVEERARAVGVKAALPLGLCLLPAFLLVGIVPLVAGLLSSLSL